MTDRTEDFKAAINAAEISAAIYFDALAMGAVLRDKCGTLDRTLDVVNNDLTFRAQCIRRALELVYGTTDAQQVRDTDWTIEDVTGVRRAQR